MTNWQEKDVRIEQIIKAVVNAIERYGLDNLTMNIISQEAGLSKGAINHYFPKKQDILHAVIDQLDREFFQEVDKRIEVTTKPEEKLTHRLAGGVDVAKNYPALLLVVVSLAISDMSLRERTRRLFRKYRRLSGIGVLPGIEAGVLKEADQEIVGTILLGLIIGIAVQWVLEIESFDIDRVSEMAQDMLLCALKKN